MPENKRIECVDITKGLAIIVVVISHLVMVASISNVITRVFGGLMGVFFMLSSYFYKPGKGYLFNVKKRFFQIIIPFLVYNLVVILLVFLYESLRGTNMAFVEYLKVYWQRIYDSSSLTEINLGPDTGMRGPRGALTSIASMALVPSWFLHRMFFSELIFFAVADWALENTKRVACTIAVLLTITVLYVQFVPVHLPLQLDSCFAIAAIMLFGSYMRKLNAATYIETHPWDKKKIIITAIFLVLYVLAAFFLYEFFGRALINGKFGIVGSPSVYIWFFCQVIFFYVMLLFGSLLAHVGLISSMFKLVGRHTLIILLFHMFIGNVAGQILTWAFGYESKPTWISLVSVVIAVFLSLRLSIARDAIKKGISSRRQLKAEGV